MTLRMRGAAAFVGMAIAGWPALAHAHSWYPPECCHGSDCAPVESATWLMSKDGRLPQLMVRSREGVAIIPQDMSPRESKDSRMHVCMSYDMFGDLKVFCIFVPPIF